jgi:hypothetical protein
MRTHRLLVTVLLLLALTGGLFGAAGTALAGQGDVPQVWNMGPTPPWGWWRFDGHYYAPQGLIYFLGGRSGGAGTTLPDVWAFNPVAGVYTDTLTDIPAAVSNYLLVQLTDATGPGLFIFGGFGTGGAYLTSVQVYYPETNTAVTVAGDTWPGTTTVPTSGCVDFPGAVVSYNNKAYIVGGFAQTGCATAAVSDQFWIYDPMAAAGSRFTAGPALTAPRGYMQLAIIDNYLYAVGGTETDGTALTPTARVERLDLNNVAGGWDDASVADMPTASSGIAGCDQSHAYGFDTGSITELAGSLVVVGCGQGTGGSPLTDSFQYVAATNTWAAWDALNSARRNHASALELSATEARIWVFDGSVGGNSGDVLSSEYRTLALVPTSVKLVSVDSYSPHTPDGLWVLAMIVVSLATVAGLGAWLSRRAQA